nr:hypothetical protein [uncultured Halomonas sp.]
MQSVENLTAHHRFFVCPLNGHRRAIEGAIENVLVSSVTVRPALDGRLLKPTAIEPGTRHYLIPMRWFSGKVITLDSAATAHWFWLDADIPFNSPLAKRLARQLVHHPEVLCLAEDNTREAIHESAKAWIIDDAHYLVQGNDRTD